LLVLAAGIIIEEALDKTAEMIRGYIKSMEANRKKIPLSPVWLAALKCAAGLL
jgi:predicted RNase H-like HicB family nuclease